MAKRTTRRHGPGPQVDEVGHLEEALTDVTSTTAAAFKKYRYHIVAAVAVLTILIVGFSVVGALQEHNLARENEKVWTLLLSPAAQKEGPSLQALEGLLEDARGSEIEQYVVKTVGEHLARRAAEEATDATPAAGGVPKEEAYQRVLELARDVKTRFRDDADLQKWAEGVQKKLEGEHDTSWLPASPKYALPLPAPRAPSGKSDS